MINIIPLNDMEKHEESTTCKCKPKVEILENGEIMIIHNAFDNRKIIEQINMN